MSKYHSGNSCKDIACEYYIADRECPARHICAGYEEKAPDPEWKQNVLKNFMKVE